MPGIILATINAKYIHASLGLRYLYANMADLQSQTLMQEFTLAQRADDIAESILKEQPRIVGFGVYIWNVDLTLEVIRLIKTISPEVSIVIGGPEVSYELTEQEICKLADHVILGQADQAFYGLCDDILHDRPVSPIVSPLPFTLADLTTPYQHYNDDDLANRVLYVEASRGCPFKCEFCLSSLDKTATPFDLDDFLHEMKMLIDRGARQFKFVDRTFNLKAETSRRILEFFLAEQARREDQHRQAQQAESQKTGLVDEESSSNTTDLFLHFELIPDRLPEPLRDLLPQFQPGTLQFEIGIQSFNPEVQKRISRKQQHEKTCENMRWLRANTSAHIHADLIVGLPGEDIDSFGEGFDLLHSLGPQEIQVGILKRLRGTPIDRHSAEFDMRYAKTAPYRILSNREIDFPTMQRLVRFARYWDLLGNSGRFPATLDLLLGSSPFKRFLAFSDWLFQSSEQTHRISLHRWFDFLHQGLPAALGTDLKQVHSALLSDFEHNALKGKPAFLRSPGTAGHDAASEPVKSKPVKPVASQMTAKAASRQHRHIGQTG